MLAPKYQLSAEEDICETEPHWAAARLPTTLQRTEPEDAALLEMAAG